MTAKKQVAKLTQAYVRNLNHPNPDLKTRPVIYDSQVPSFGVRITPSGHKSFVIYKRVSGRPQFVTLGTFPAMNVDEARAEAWKNHGEINKGLNPQVEKKRARQEATLGEYWNDSYWPNHASKKSFAADEQSKFDRHLKKWAGRKLSAILFQDVQRLHRLVGRKSPIAANRLISLVSHIFTEAKRDGYFFGENPAEGIRRNPETPRERFLLPEELPGFFEALADERNETFRDYVWFSILTGQRQGNICSMRFDEIDFSSATWTIPPNKSKAKNTIRVPLHEKAIQILRERREWIDGPFVLPGPGEAGHYNEPKKAWKSFIDRAGLTDFRPHDMRHTLGSWQAISGSGQAVIAKSLGHKSANTAAIYTQIHIDPVRDSVNKALDTILAVGKVKEPAPVVDLPKRRKRGA